METILRSLQAIPTPPAKSTREIVQTELVFLQPAGGTRQPPHKPFPIILVGLQFYFHGSEKAFLQPPQVLDELLLQCARLAETGSTAKSETSSDSLFGQVPTPGTGLAWKELAQTSRLLPDGEAQAAEATAALHRFLRERRIPSALPEGTLEALVPALERL